MGLWNRWNVCKYFLRVSHRSLWITFFLFSIYYNITCFENEFNFRYFFLCSSRMERSLTLLFTCVRSVLGKKSDQTPITDFCRLSNCRHWLLIFCTIHHRIVREKNYKKNVFSNLCFYFSSRFHSRAAREGDITHWPTFLASHIFSDIKTKNVWILVYKCWLIKRLVEENLTVVVISMHVKRVLALILSETTLRFDQLITSLSSDGLITDRCAKQYTEAPTSYSARSNLSHIDPDHRCAPGDISFSLLRIEVSNSHFSVAMGW